MPACRASAGGHRAIGAQQRRRPCTCRVSSVTKSEDFVKKGRQAAEKQLTAKETGVLQMSVACRLVPQAEGRVPTGESSGA